MTVSSALLLAEYLRREKQAIAEALRHETRPHDEPVSTASGGDALGCSAKVGSSPARPGLTQGHSWEMANAITELKRKRAAAGLFASHAAAFTLPALPLASQETEAPASATSNNLVGAEIARPPAPGLAQNEPKPEAKQFAPSHVKTFVELNLAALQVKKDGLLRLYYVLRAHDPNGQGWVAEETARDATGFMYSWSGARYWLRKGNRSWWVWDKPAGRIILRKPAYVAAALGVSQVLRRPVAIPLADLATEAGASAALYATIHTERQAEAEDRARRIVVNAMLKGKAAAIPYEANPISKQVLSDMTGLHRSTLTRYDKLARLKKKTNITNLRLSDTQANRDSLKARGIAGVFSYRQIIPRRGRKPVYDNVLAARLPDTFDAAPGQTPLKRNNHKRINISLLDLAFRKGTDNQVKQESTESRNVTRFYYDSAEKVCKAAKKDHLARDRFWRKGHGRGRTWWECLISNRHDEIARLDPQERAWAVLNHAAPGGSVRP